MVDGFTSDYLDGLRRNPQPADEESAESTNTAAVSSCALRQEAPARNASRRRGMSEAPRTARAMSEPSAGNPSNRSNASTRGATALMVFGPAMLSAMKGARIAVARVPTQ